jgi:hypothetical protein
VVAQGLLQYLAVVAPKLVWASFGSWLRTIRPGIPPSELVVAQALRQTLPDFLLVSCKVCALASSLNGASRSTVFSHGRSGGELTRPTLAALGDSSYFLPRVPRVFMYFDDFIGDDTWLCNEFTGERLAIGEFNQTHQSRKISKNYYAAKIYPNSFWSDLIYICHDFEHPRYNDFVADKEQVRHQNAIKQRK